MAFIQAISAAAITHEIAYQCTQNKIPGCGCPLPVSTYSHCGDNILFGEKKSRPFTDRLKKQHDPQTDLILHNNALGREVTNLIYSVCGLIATWRCFCVYCLSFMCMWLLQGRRSRERIGAKQKARSLIIVNRLFLYGKQVVRTSAVLSCKCYPSLTTPYCMATSCWKKLAPFEVVASKLREKYREALQVGLVPRPYDPINRVVSAKDQNLVYLEDSPSFCEQSHTLGYRGTLGRSCRSDVAEDRCKLFIELCNACNLRVEKVARYKRVNCSCKFIYCCKVECEKCSEEYSEITCNALKAVDTDILGRAHP